MPSAPKRRRSSSGAFDWCPDRSRCTARDPYRLPRWAGAGVFSTGLVALANRESRRRSRNRHFCRLRDREFRRARITLVPKSSRDRSGVRQRATGNGTTGLALGDYLSRNCNGYAALATCSISDWQRGIERFECETRPEAPKEEPVFFCVEKTGARVSCFVKAFPFRSLSKPHEA